MAAESRHVSVFIERTAADVYAFASDPAHLSRWAAGLAATPLERVDGRWVAESPMGRVTVAFVAPNDLGVLDHDVTLPSGEVVTNPMRVLVDDDHSEVVFTVRQRPGMSDDEFAHDVAAVRADLETLKQVVESEPTPS